jgi:hypothetical protein
MNKSSNTKNVQRILNRNILELTAIDTNKLGIGNSCLDKSSSIYKTRTTNKNEMIVFKTISSLNQQVNCFIIKKDEVINRIKAIIKTILLNGASIKIALANQLNTQNSKLIYSCNTQFNYCKLQKLN